MNTHIIIPIKDIKEYHTKLGQKEFYERYKNAKQISLDEKDIEEKAEKLAIAESGCSGKEQHSQDCCCSYYETGYKQALKDLL